MNVRDIAKILTERVPNADTWCPNETYGGQECDIDTEVKKVLWCVTAHDNMVPYCKEKGYDMLISHHPMVVKGIPQVVLHTALDCTKGGLNDMWKDFLNVGNAQHFDRNLGWYGAIEPMKFSDLVKKCEAFIGSSIIGEAWAKDGPDTMISSVVICTGLGGMVTEQAAKTGADCYVLGESTRKAEYMGFKGVIEIGHTKSEKMGIRVVKEMLEPHGVQVDPAPDNLDWYGWKETPEEEKTKYKYPEPQYPEPQYTKKDWGTDWANKNYKRNKETRRSLQKAYGDDWTYDPETNTYYPANDIVDNPPTPSADADWDKMTEDEWNAWKVASPQERQSWFSTPEAQSGGEQLPLTLPSKGEFSVVDWERVMEEQRKKRGEEIYKTYDEEKRKKELAKGTDIKASAGLAINIVGGTDMTRAEALGQFQVDEAGNITTPGLFTGQPIYTPYFYDRMMAGDGETLYFPNGMVVILNVGPEDIKEFPELGAAKQVALEELDEGRIASTVEPGVIDGLREDEKGYWDMPQKAQGEPAGGAIQSQGAAIPMEVAPAEAVSVGDKVEFPVSWLGTDSYSQGEVAEIGPEGIVTVYITGDPRLIEHVPMDRLTKITDYAPTMFGAPQDIVDAEEDVESRRNEGLEDADFAVNGSKIKKMVINAMSYTDAKGQLRASYLLGQAQSKIWREAAESINKDCGKEIKARVEKLWKWGTACLPEDAIRDVIQKVLQEKDIYPYPQLVGHIYAKLPKKWSADPYQTRAIGPDEQATGGSEPR